MARMTDGSPSASPSAPGLENWARAYADDLKRFLAKRRLVESDIKDVCQEVYLRLLRFQRAEIVQNPHAYLFRVAANVAHDFKLRRPQWASLDAQTVDEMDREPAPEEIAESTYRARCLMRVMAELPPLPRAAVVLQFREGLSYAQI